MAHGHQTRFQDDQDASYMTLPGMGSTSFVTQNWTPAKARINTAANIHGCHPARWVNELINNEFTACDVFRRARQAGVDYGYTWDHAHALVVNGNQNCSTPSSRLLSAVCLDCHFHFVFRMEWDSAHDEDLCNPSNGGWPLQDHMFPWHHLTWVGSDTEVNIARDQTKYYPIVAREDFVCSAGPCTFSLRLEISKPRLPTHMADLLLDSDGILEQLNIAREREPNRYEEAPDRWAQEAPMNLNTYLKNQLECEPGKSRPISKRNKRFAVLFGPRCFPIFQLLEFEEEVIDREGLDEGSFKPVEPEAPNGPNSTTVLGSYRAFIEDIRSEVQCLIHVKGQAGGQPAGTPTETPTWCLPALYNDLRIVTPPSFDNPSYAKLLGSQDYANVGVLPSQPRQAIVNAYKRQWDLVPSMRRQLVDSLMVVANDIGDEHLSSYAVTQSSVFESQGVKIPAGSHENDEIVPEALDFLGLQPPNTHSAETIIRAVRRKLATEPTHASTVRTILLIIAKPRSDDGPFHDALVMETHERLTFFTAMAVLGLSEESTDSEAVVRAAKTKLTKSKSAEESGVYLDALDSLALETKSAFLKQESFKLRQLNRIPPSRINMSSIVDFGLPVGLTNIGNTCYLNSLLQYLLTVKPIRDIVLNYQDIKLDLTDEAISSRRLGGNKMEMDRGEAVVAQAFTQELGTLFRNLETSDMAATKPSQRLANAVLLSTHTLLEASKQQVAEKGQPASSISVQAVDEVDGTTPPPLPARPSPMPQSHMATDPQKADLAAMSVNKVTAGTSDASGETLVDELELASAALTDHSEKLQTLQNTSDPDSITVAPISLEKRNDDIIMHDVEEDSVDQKVLRALEHQKRSSGTDQQDVEEVMGSILNRLQAAIRPSSTEDTTGIQREIILDTFFVTTVNYTRKFGEPQWQSEVSFDRSITAFPSPEGPCSLYEALGRNFDQEVLNESRLTRYTAIRSLPPVLHVLIQRSQNIGKNGNSVIIPETLYLDRYMDALHDSPTFKQRVAEWFTKKRVEDVKASIAKTGGPLPALIPPTGSPVMDDVDEREPVDFAPKEDWDFDGANEEGFVKVEKPSASWDKDFPEPPPFMADIEKRIRQTMVDELAKHEQNLGSHFENLKKIAYRLHAVICHRGALTSGHYWVWIHDFEQNLWRCYNDESVTENSNTAEVLELLSSSGEPYYLCYVQDGAQDDYVGVPRRERPAEPEVEDASAKEQDEEMNDSGVDAGESGQKDEVSDVAFLDTPADAKEESSEANEEESNKALLSRIGSDMRIDAEENQ